ncbi:hypothetical protein L2E82_13472 [Cichorium intybus]|uniref:Uncharacterized protein n=1 Tax=Cichorium intybus TaxID=13427 RepID=A0ACB9EY90_CICIN|nr:hypothetical protein L2E82_13472 [Cichorium intybus]
MDASSVRNLCRHLISSAIQRCRMSGELCRLSVSLKSSPLANPPLVRISISDTGVGSCLEEFQDVKNLSDSSMNQIHDGIISIATTRACDNEIFHYNIDLKQKDCTKRLAKLPLTPKNDAHYEGSFGIELIVDKAEFTDDQCVNVIVVNECIDLPSEANAECLKLGLVDYVLKHGNQIDSTCNSCFPIRDHLKVGSGEVCKSYKNIETKIEAVVIISELSEMMDSSCFRACDNKTEVLYFNDFSHGLISQSLLKALETVDWKSYGLSIKSISDEDGCCVTVGRNLVKKALKLALSDLKEKNAGVLLSAHAVKIRSYAPDLAKTIAGLISGSNDLNFKGECASLLGLHSHDAESIEDNIKQRLTSIIDQNDREPHTKRTRESAPLLFNDDCFEEPEFAYEEYEDGEI